MSRKGNLESRLRAMASEIDEIGQENGGNHYNLTAAIIDVFMNSGLKEKRTPRQTFVRWIPYVLLAASIGANIYSAMFSCNLKKIQDSVRADLDSLYSDISAVKDLSPVDGLTVIKIREILDRLPAEDNGNQADTTYNNEMNENEKDNIYHRPGSVD